MALNIQKKKNIVTKINTIARVASSIIISEMNSVSVNNINKLRKLAFKSEVKINVVKNTLFKLAIQNTSFECLIKKIQGPNVIAFSMSHPGSAARLLKKFQETNKNCKIKIGAFENKILSDIEINQLAIMPTYQESILNIVILLKKITVGRLIHTLIAVQNIKKNKNT